MSDHALTIAELSFSYGSKLALHKINFAVRSGECTILLGPNGAGKSTLFALITRLYDSHGGRIAIGGYNIRQQSFEALSRLGVVFQQSTLDMDLSVMQNLRYHASLHGMGSKLANSRIQEELQRQGMYERRFETIRQLNGGHRRRVEIARALLHKPALLLLDEPTVGLDMPSRQALVQHVHGLVSDHSIAVLWATHLIDEIYPEDSLVILHRGNIKALGKQPEILIGANCDSLQSAFKQLTQG